MSVELTQPIGDPTLRTELVPKFFDPTSIVTPDDNPERSLRERNELLASIREHRQLTPGFVCPSPDLPPGKLLCIEGNGRLAACLTLGIAFWAFNLGRSMSEVERIKLTFQHNLIRRTMGREELSQRAGRYMELTGCTAGEAAKQLNVSGPTLSRAFGEKRIPPELRPRAERLKPSIRSIIAACPVALMEEAVTFAETEGADSKAPTRDEVSHFVCERKGGLPKARKAKGVTLHVGERAVSISLGPADTAAAVLKDLNALIAELGKHSKVSPEGWPFLLR